MKDTNVVTRKYQFGAITGVIEGKELAIQQMRSRNYLRNDLINLSNEFNPLYWEVVNRDNKAGVRIDEINREIAILYDDIGDLRVKARRVAVGKCCEKDKIAALESERKDSYPISKAAQKSNAKKFKAELVKQDADYYARKQVLLKRAAKAYVHTHVTEAGETITANVDAMYQCNNGEIDQLHETARSRAMVVNGGTLYRKGFKGEGRTYNRAFMSRDMSGDNAELFNTLMEPIRKLDEAIKAVAQKGLSKQDADKQRSDLIKQRTALEAERDSQVSPIKGETEETIFVPNAQFYIDPVNLQRDAQNPTVWDKSVPRGERQRRQHTVAHVRVGSIKAKPVWCNVPINLDRPFPIGSTIIMVAINCKKLGQKFLWNVEFTVKFIAIVPPMKGDGIIAGDIGWAKDSLPNADGRIRVMGYITQDREVKSAPDAGLCTAQTLADRLGEILLEPAYYQYAEALHGLQATRDAKTNEVFAELTAYLQTNTITDPVIGKLIESAMTSYAKGQKEKTPQMWGAKYLQRAVVKLRATDTETDARIKAINKELKTLRSDNTVKADLRPDKARIDLLKAERKSLVAGDGLRTVLEKWFERWHHLNNWLVNGKDNTTAWRKDYYRRTAYKLAQENTLLLIDADNYAEMAKTPERTLDKKACKNGVRFQVAPGVLRSALENAFSMAKGRQILWASISSSITCRKCGNHNDEPLGASRTFKCEACGHTSDRELNAAGKLMDEYRRNPGSFYKDKNFAMRLAAKKAKEAKDARKAKRANVVAA